MAGRSAIEWTDATWQPITGCSVVSPGCTNCYAMKLAGTRLRHHPSRKGLTVDSKSGPVWNGKVRFNEQWLTQPLGWKSPRRIFVCAHGDLFHEDVPDEWIDRVFAVMALAPQHTFQVLTKRAARMQAYINNARDRILIGGTTVRVTTARSYRSSTGIDVAKAWPLANVWLGVSAEDQRRADERLPHLLATPAAVRFVSAEPLLGPIDLERVGTIASVRAAMPQVLEREDRGRPSSGNGSISGAQIDAVGRAGSSITFFQTPDHMGGFTAASPRLWPVLDWVIVGGESGDGARPMHPDWARALRDQCEDTGVAFFFKQWGAWTEIEQFDPTGDSAYHWDRERAGQPAFISTALGFDGRISDRADDVPAPHAHVHNVGKKRAGRLLDGVEYNGMPGARQ